MSVEIDHLGIAVRSLEEGIAFYRDLIGLPLAGEEFVAVERVRVAMLPASDQASASRLELLEASDDSSPIAQFIKSRGPGLHHVALRVDDLQATLARLTEQGCRVLNEPQSGAGGHQYAFIHPYSTGGVLLELIQKKI